MTLEEYYNELTEAYKKNAWYFITNEDRAHNATIMRVMLENATKICMFCGELSVFREGFYTHIDNDGGQGQLLKGNVAAALLSFLKKEGTELSIVMEKFGKDLKEDFILSSEDLKEIRKIKLYALDKSFSEGEDLSHFSFTENEKMTRIELNEDTHEAICKIGENNLVNNTGLTLDSSFKVLVKHSKVVEVA